MNKKTAIKAIFFDIDGTLVSFKTHRIPASTIEALREAKQAGVKIVIATGRPFSIINNLAEIESLVDGWMTTNGAHCVIDGKNVSLQTLAPQTVEWIMKVCTEQHVPCLVVGTEGLAWHCYTQEANDWFLYLLNIDCRKIALPLQEVLQMPIIQMTTLLPQEKQKLWLPGSNEYMPMRWHTDFNDITHPRANKGIGLEAMARHWGLSINETAAFGDGANDLPMIRRAGVGVAMGNAMPDVKQEADMVTDAVDENGVHNALKALGVI